MTLPESLTIVRANLSDPGHAAAVLALTDAYARDPMGNDAALDPAVRARLIDGLNGHPTTLVFLAYVDQAPAGIATCFRGFSTFNARPLINVHDLSVLPALRGMGIGRALLDAVEREARASGCCRITLEVREDNLRARRAYAAAGFGPASADGRTGAATYFFLSKPL